MFQMGWFMLFRKRIKKVLDIEGIEKAAKEAEPVKLEKGDFAAMLIAAVITIGPILLGFIGVMFLIAWLFGAFG